MGTYVREVGGIRIRAFRRALDRGDLLQASTHAKDLKHVGLAEAFELALLILEKEPTRYERAALRVHARLVSEANLGLRDATTALALLAGLAGNRARESAYALADLLGCERKLVPVAEVLVRWTTAAA